MKHKYYLCTNSLKPENTDVVVKMGGRWETVELVRGPTVMTYQKNIISAFLRHNRNTIIRRKLLKENYSNNCECYVFAKIV